MWSRQRNIVDNRVSPVDPAQIEVLGQMPGKIRDKNGQGRVRLSTVAELFERPDHANHS